MISGLILKDWTQFRQNFDILNKYWDTKSGLFSALRKVPDQPLVNEVNRYRMETKTVVLLQFEGLDCQTPTPTILCSDHLNCLGCF